MYSSHLYAQVKNMPNLNLHKMQINWTPEIWDIKSTEIILKQLVKQTGLTGRVCFSHAV